MNPCAHPRAAAALLTLAGAGLLAGCAAPAADEAAAAGPYCFHNPLLHGRHTPCIDGPLPDAAQDEAAHQFPADPQRLTVYVVRQNWSDGPARLTVRVDGQPAADTLPSTLLRLRLAPGAHVLDFAADGEPPRAIAVEGPPGQVRYLHLATLAGLWHTGHDWEVEPEAVAQARARKARLVADLQLGAPSTSK